MRALVGSHAGPRTSAALTPILASVSLKGTTVATVGTGVMAESMITGLLKGERLAAAQVIASDPRAERREELATRHGVRTTESNVAAVEAADIIVLAIKPQMLRRVGPEVAPRLRPEQLVISVLAGATTKALRNALRHDAIVRAMPNTPAQLGKGMTVWYATPQVSELQRAQTAELMGALGRELEVDDEGYVAMATAVSGTGPAYVFLVMEALIDAAVHLGFPRHIAHDLVIETLLGGTLFAQATRRPSRHSCATWSPRRPARPLRPSPSWRRVACARCCPRPSGRPTGAPRSSATSSRSRPPSDV